MSDDLQAQDATPNEPEAQDADGQAEPGAAKTIDVLPEWAQQMVRDLRAENAKHRKAKTEAEKAAEAAARAQAEEQGKFKELYEDALSKLSEATERAKSAELARLKSVVSARHSLPAALADRLRGETEEELEADAMALLDAMPKAQPATRTDGAAGVNGKTPTPKKTEAEIRELAARLGVSYEHLKLQYE